MQRLLLVCQISQSEGLLDDQFVFIFLPFVEYPFIVANLGEQVVPLVIQPL